MSDLGQLARLPTAVTDADTPAKMFDHLILRMQLAMLRVQPTFKKMAEQVATLARFLEEKSTIPMVQSQLALLQELQAEDFWRHATLWSLEDVRLRMRALVKLIERGSRPIVITDFEDELRAHTNVADLIVRPTPAVDIEKFRAKARHFLARYDARAAIQHLKWNEPITREDLEELEEIFLVEGADATELEVVKRSEMGLGLFVRSLVGLDRAAAQQAMQVFGIGETLTANQREFVELVIEYLTRKGYVDAQQIFAAPFTDLHPDGAAGVFDDDGVRSMLSILVAIRRNAEGLSSEQ